MNTLKIFILIGIVDSHDGQFATVELNLNPATNGGAASAVMPVSAFPCEIKEGSRFFVVKLIEEQEAVIICAADDSIKQ